MNTFANYLAPCNLEIPSIKKTEVALEDRDLTKIRHRLHRLEERAPSNASIGLSFINSGLNIQGELNITSRGNQFKVTQQGNDPWEIYKQLEPKIDQQITAWKKDRFTNKVTLKLGLAK